MKENLSQLAEIYSKKPHGKYGRKADNDMDPNVEELLGLPELKPSLQNTPSHVRKGNYGYNRDKIMIKKQNVNRNSQILPKNDNRELYGS